MAETAAILSTRPVAGGSANGFAETPPLQSSAHRWRRDDIPFAAQLSRAGRRPVALAASGHRLPVAAEFAAGGLWQWPGRIVESVFWLWDSLAGGIMNRHRLTFAIGILLVACYGLLP